MVTVPLFGVHPALSELPSINDGIMCVAKGKSEKGGNIYLYTSLIDNASMKQKKPVTVTINESMTDVVEGEVMVFNKQQETLTVDAFGAAMPPEMQPVGMATTTYQGNYTFTGKTKAGTPVSFTLENNYRIFKIKHGDKSFAGSCH
ncbi:hypothetical protein H6G45_17025 [Synechocystis sp. FACHB-383]|uniref:hypothetical protein n=1 Tax=Synechocystis sp. FACHB-383 TaxID=2692864 RepID=UPI00168713D4|nr:hypothetical protein [Synechocystis sp. FACHB-383]MBD2655157.1 hypothetical protein [Synechocystis sp. FACHB-383]